MLIFSFLYQENLLSCHLIDAMSFLIYKKHVCKKTLAKELRNFRNLAIVIVSNCKNCEQHFQYQSFLYLLQNQTVDLVCILRSQCTDSTSHIFSFVESILTDTKVWFLILGARKNRLVSRSHYYCRYQFLFFKHSFTRISS